MGFGMSDCPVSIALKTMLSRTASVQAQVDTQGNAVAESFFATLKVEFVHGTLFRTRAQATREIFEYIEMFYNRARRHSSIGHVSPLEFERNYVTHHQAV